MHEVRVSSVSDATLGILVLILHFFESQQEWLTHKGRSPLASYAITTPSSSLLHLNILNIGCWNWTFIHSYVKILDTAPTGDRF